MDSGATPPLPEANPRNLALRIASWGLLVVLETATQVVFKIAGATFHPDGGVWPMVQAAAGTPVVYLGFALYFCAFLCWMTILRETDLGRAFPMTASVYFGTVSAGLVFFGEHLTPMRIVGVLVIVVGIGVLAFDRNSPKGKADPSIGPVHG